MRRLISLHGLFVAAGKSHNMGNCLLSLTSWESNKTDTSLEIHTGMGMGYSVCEKCYQDEIKRKLEED